jgi:MFS family permease
MLSLANMSGRFVWSSTSDLIGRKNVYRLYLGAGALSYLVIAIAGNASKPLFIICTMLILSFYGGGFATIPAYLKDLFGTYQVGAIHGRLLTAWSTAGVLGPLIVNAIADAQKSAGRTRCRSTSWSGCSPSASPPTSSYAPSTPASTSRRRPRMSTPTPEKDRRPLIAFAWLWVSAPFAYGLYELFLKAAKLFSG